MHPFRAVGVDRGAVRTAWQTPRSSRGRAWLTRVARQGAQLAATVALGLLAGPLASCVLAYDEDAAAIECDGPCADGASCASDGQCYCQEGTYAEDPSDESSTCDPVLRWTMVDQCDDAQDIRWKLFSQSEDGFTWPASDADPPYYLTEGFGQETVFDIVCIENEIICLGAESEELYWGVSLTGLETCDDCCFECIAGEVADYGIMSCP